MGQKESIATQNSLLSLNIIVTDEEDHSRVDLATTTTTIPTSRMIRTDDPAASYVDLGVASSSSSSQNEESTTTSTTTTVAIIGGGVSGLAAAWHLHENCGCPLTNNNNHHNNIRYDVHVFESNDRLGGHAWTIETTDAHGDVIPVDIGFMVFNEMNYPNLMEWFKCLSVQSQLSDMSLSVSLDGGKTVEWNSGGLMGLFGSRPQQALSPAFLSFLYDMIRFNSTAVERVFSYNIEDESDPRRHRTTREFLFREGYSTAFAEYYLLPMMAALWSASIQDVLDFPASSLISFLSNHQMLQIFHRPTWRTVQGRSLQYVKAVEQCLGPTKVHLRTAIHSIQVVEIENPNHPNPRHTKKYRLLTTRTTTMNNTNQVDAGTDGTTTTVTDEALAGVLFDEIIFACHAPTARTILEQSSGMTTSLPALLQHIEYADNIVYVHSDPTLMPKSLSTWASWNCLGKSQELKRTMMATTAHTKKKGALEGAESGFGNTLNDSPMDKDSSATEEGPDGRFRAVYVTYWLNRLQSLQTDTNMFVSLNPHTIPDKALTHHRVIMAHPQFTERTLLARKELARIQGNDGLWFCGAYFGYGFHEDGCRSGFETAVKLSGVPVPWATENTKTGVLSPPNFLQKKKPGMLLRLYRKITVDLPVYICQQLVCYFLQNAIRHGTLRLKLPNGSSLTFGDGKPCGSDAAPVTLRIFDLWWFVKVAVSYDLGLARSYMAGQFIVEPLADQSQYHPLIRPADHEPKSFIGDPAGLTRLFLLIIGNRDYCEDQKHVPKKSGRGPLLWRGDDDCIRSSFGKDWNVFNYIRYKLTMDNSERGGSLRNIHAHYDLSNDLFRTFLDTETLMYSSAIFDAIQAPAPQTGLVFRDTLEQAQWRKLDTLLMRAQVQPGQTLLDIGFGWGGLSIHAARKYGCTVTGITLSVEQKALAEARVKENGLDELITFEVVDYRVFARRKENRGKFDRVLSCEMIEAVGHNHLGAFFWSVEQVLAPGGVLVMEAITTPEERYENYRRSTDFINSIIFPGSLCPSLHALVDAAYRESTLTLEHIDNIGLHYAQTLAEWRRRFNANEETVRKLGFDDVFFRAWNYYFTYCEAGFFSQTENCLILVFARQGCKSLLPLCETRSVTQFQRLTETETNSWLTDSMV